MPDDVFIDTAHVAALINPRDPYHLRAMDVAGDLAGRRCALVTTDAVLVEVANFFSRSTLRSTAALWIRTLRSADTWSIIPHTDALIARAEARYRQFDDKNWSMTDCISMEVMAERRIAEVATTDRGFEQAGFTVLLA